MSKGFEFLLIFSKLLYKRVKCLLNDVKMAIFVLKNHKLRQKQLRSLPLAPVCEMQQTTSSFFFKQNLSYASARVVDCTVRYISILKDFCFYQCLYNSKLQSCYQHFQDSKFFFHQDHFLTSQPPALQKRSRTLIDNRQMFQPLWENLFLKHLDSITD